MDADTRGKPETVWSQPVWARQAGESDRAFEAFGAYRDAGPSRSAGIVSEALGKSRALIERWSAAWGWVERAGAWDDEADRNRRERDLIERADARRRMLDDHARVGKSMVSVAQSGLALLDVDDPETGEEARKRIAALSPAEIARLLDTGAKVERQARGEATRVVDPDAMAWLGGLLDVCLAYLPLDQHEALLADVNARLGVGGLAS